MKYTIWTALTLTVILLVLNLFGAGIPLFWVFLPLWIVPVLVGVFLVLFGVWFLLLFLIAIVAVILGAAS